MTDKDLASDCNYLQEFSKNAWMQEYIHKHVCSNFPDRFTDQDNRKCCIFHSRKRKKKKVFSDAFHEKVAQKHFVFTGTWFPIPVDFSGFHFESLVDFNHCRFSRDVSFVNSDFFLFPTFIGAVFKSKVSFKDTRFTTIKDLTEYPVLQNGPIITSFVNVQFKDVVEFDFSVFRCIADFTGARFIVAHNGYDKDLLLKAYNTSFLDVTFGDDVLFKDAVFGNPRRRETVDTFSFSGATFEKRADFRYVEFIHGVRFTSAVFKETLDFRETRFHKP